MIEPRDKDLVGGTVRELIGIGVIRDTVSISGGSAGAKIRKVLVDNVRGYRSSKRGALEVSDGTDNVTVRKVYAEDCIYAVDVHLHHVTAPDVRPAGILLTAERNGGTLTNFLISENLAQVVNTMTTSQGLLCNNLPEAQKPAESTASPSTR